MDCGFYMIATLAFKELILIFVINWEWDFGSVDSTSFLPLLAVVQPGIFQGREGLLE